VAIDEYLTLFKTFTLFSRNIALAKDFNVHEQQNSYKMFGGLDILLVGDLHQIPPIGKGRSECLFTPENISEDTVLQITGRRMYQGFQTVGNMICKIHSKIRIEQKYRSGF
jgi:hypothetical protein